MHFSYMLIPLVFSTKWLVASDLATITATSRTPVYLRLRGVSPVVVSGELVPPTEALIFTPWETTSE